MPSDEAREILRLLAAKKIDAEQAYRLLVALGDVPGERARASARRERSEGGRVLRIRVTEGGTQKVNIAVPLAIARLERVKGLRHITKRFGLDLDEILQDVRTTSGGKIVDIADDDDRVEVFVE